jgi:hypothetical protein
MIDIVNILNEKLVQIPKIELIHAIKPIYLNRYRTDKSSMINDIK